MVKTIHVQQGVGTFEERDDSAFSDTLALPSGIQTDLLDMGDIAAEATIPAAKPLPVLEVASPDLSSDVAVQAAPRTSKPRRGRLKGTGKRKTASVKPKPATKPTPTQRNMFTVVSLLIPPVLISFISALHMFEFFLMANPPFMAIVLAVSYEILNIAVLVAIWQFSVMSKGTRTFIWSALFVLVALLIVGNCYANYLHLDPEAISKFAAQWGLPNDVTTSRILALLHGSLLPITTVAFVKAVANYWLKTEKK